MRLPSRQSTLIGALALLGLALAVGLAVLASRISTQHIGVAADSPDSGARLVAPAPTTTTTATTPAKRHKIHHKRPSTPVRTTTVTVVVPARPVTPPPVVATPAPPTRTVAVPAAPSITSTPPARSGSGDDSQSPAHRGADD